MFYSTNFIFVFFLNFCIYVSGIFLKSHFSDKVVPDLLDPADGGDVVHLSAPPVVAVVLAPLRHVPQVLPAAVVVMLVADPPTVRPTVPHGGSQSQSTAVFNFSRS